MSIRHTLAAALALFAVQVASAQDMNSVTSLPGATSAMPTEEKEVEAHMMKMDTDKNGFISRQEADSEMLTGWKQWDRNEDGKIDPSEYSSAAKAAPKNEKLAR